MAKVTDEAFNLVQNKIASIIGSPSGTVFDLGYNLAVASLPAVQGAKVVGQDLNLVIQDVNLAIEHQTGLSTGLAIYNRSQLIETDDLTEVSAKVDIAYASRTTAGVGKLQITTSDNYVNGSTWKTEHKYKVRFDWGSNAEFRGWANLGGFITIGGSMTGGSGSSQTSSWTNIFQAIGILVFSGNSAIQQNQSRNGSFPNGGLYNLLQNGQTGVNAGIAFRILASDANYTSNSFTIYIRPYGGNNVLTATGFEIEYVLLDPHVATGQGPDLVDGTLGFSVNTYYSYNKTPTATQLGSTLG